MGFRVLLSVMILSYCLMINVFGVDLDHVSWTQAPHHAPSYPPVGAPAPHHHHHKRPGGHHHKPGVPPTAHTPSVAPVHPPTVAPVHPPTVAPVHPPTKAPVHPPKAPVHPPTKSPVHPPIKAPVHPPTKAPVHPPTKSPIKAPVHPPTKAPVHPPVKAPVHPPTKAPVHPPTKSPVYPPTKAPVHPPAKSPVYPPTKAPVQPPSHSPAPSHAPLPTRKLVAVRGMVYCKACKYKGVETLFGATPLQGAVVLLTCKNTKYTLRVKGTTDKNGFFFIMPPKTLTTFGVHKCKVTLLSSPKVTCNQPTNLHYGLKGATLVPTPKPIGSSLHAPPLPFDVFTVGPFAFEPSKKIRCPK